MKKQKPERWAPWSMGRVRIRAMTDPRDDGRARCRLEWYPTADGKPVVKPIGWVNEDEAETEAAKVIANGLPVPEKAATRGGAVELRTVEDLMQTWLHTIENNRPDLSPMTVKRYRQATLALLGTKEAPQLRYHVLDGLNRDGMQRWITQSQRQGVAGTSIEVSLVVLGIAWRWAADLGYLSGNPPVRGLKFKKEGRYNRRTPTPGEVEATIAEMSSPVIAAATRLLWASGAREGELAVLAWEEIDLEGGWITLHGRDEGNRSGKGAPREVPLSRRGKEALVSLQPDPKLRRGRVFSFTVTSFCRRIYYAIHEGAKRAGVDPWTPHGLRRLAVDEFLRSGVDVGTTAAITGHSAEIMLKHYRKVTREDKRAALVKARLGEAPAGKVTSLRGRTRKT